MTTAAPARPAATPPSAGARDRFLDLVRLAAMVLVVAQHWLLPMLVLDGAAVVPERADVLAHLWPATWVTQVMPLVFFTSGAATVLSLRGRAVPDGAWVSRRLVRLVGGLVVLAAVWLPLPPVLLAAGLDPELVSVGGRMIGGLLWFLVVLVLLTVLTPVLLRVVDRCRGVEIGVLAAAAVGIDVLRFGLGWEEAGYVNAVLVWAAVHALGMHAARGRLGRLHGRFAALVGLAGVAALGLLVVLGPYPAAMIGLPGTTVSNMNPPSAALLALAVGQVGLLHALRGPLTRLVERPVVAAAVDRWVPHTMAVYLWHTPAAVVVATGMVALGVEGHPVGSAGWWLMVPVWLLGSGAVLALSVAATRRFALRGAGVTGRRLVGGAALVVLGVLALTVSGFDPARLPALHGPLVATWALVAGALLLGARPAGAPGRRTGMVA